MSKTDRARKRAAERAAERAAKLKAAPVGLPGLAKTVKRQPNGQKRRNEDARKVVRAARARHAGVAADDALDPLLATDLGKCIRALAVDTKEDQERTRLGKAWHAISASRRNFRMLVIGQTGDPQNAALPLIHETIETDPSMTVDHRTPDERVEAAIKSWGEWDQRIKALPVPQLRWAIRGALDGFMGEVGLWNKGKPTATGRAAVTALRKMCEDA